jgi:hypothetical protein
MVLRLQITNLLFMSLLCVVISSFQDLTVDSLTLVAAATAGFISAFLLNECTSALASAKAHLETPFLSPDLVTRPAQRDGFLFDVFIFLKKT